MRYMKATWDIEPKHDAAFNIDSYFDGVSLVVLFVWNKVNDPNLSW
jgi:hypothetical protein